MSGKLAENNPEMQEEVAENESADCLYDNDGITSNFVMECLAANALGDGMLYAAIHKDKFIFAKHFDCWFAWDQHTWISDDLDWAVAAVENVALRYAAEIPTLWAKYGEAMAKGPDGKTAAASVKDKIDQIHKRVSRLRSDAGRNNCLKFAHTNPINALAIKGTEFDENPMLLACQNGVIDLESGELRPGRATDYISKRCGVRFPDNSGDPELFKKESDATLFKETLLQIYSGRQEEVDFMQRLYGYGISGLNTEHVFPVLVGRGRNGKSLVMETLEHVLGDYAGPVPAEMLLDGNRVQAGGSDPALMALKGLRLGIASETDEGRKFSSSKVKWLSGGDTIIARGLYDKKLTKFLPTHLLVLLTNHEPTPPATDFAFWERCWLIKHAKSFVDRQAEKDLLPNEMLVNKKLPAELKKIGPAILYWLVDGFLKWKNDGGLRPPESVKKYTAEYQNDENYITQFLEATCNMDKKSKTAAGDLYRVFQRWYKETINKNDRFTPSQKRFGSHLMDTGFFERFRTGGYYHYWGVSIKPEYKHWSVKNDEE